MGKDDFQVAEPEQRDCGLRAATLPAAAHPGHRFQPVAADQVVEIASADLEMCRGLIAIEQPAVADRPGERIVVGECLQRAPVVQAVAFVLADLWDVALPVELEQDVGVDVDREPDGEQLCGFDGADVRLGSDRFLDGRQVRQCSLYCAGRPPTGTVGRTDEAITHGTFED